MRQWTSLVCVLLVAAGVWAQEERPFRLPDIVVTGQEEYAVRLPRGADLGPVGSDASRAAGGVVDLQASAPDAPEMPVVPPPPDFRVPVKLHRAEYQLLGGAGSLAAAGLALNVLLKNRSARISGAVEYKEATQEAPAFNIWTSVSYEGSPALPLSLDARTRVAAVGSPEVVGHGAAFGAWTPTRAPLVVRGGGAFDATVVRSELRVAVSGETDIPLSPLTVRLGVPAVAVRYGGSGLHAAGGAAALLGGRFASGRGRLYVGASAVAGFTGAPILPQLFLSVDHNDRWTSWVETGYWLDTTGWQASGVTWDPRADAAVVRGLRLGSSHFAPNTEWQLDMTLVQRFGLSELKAPILEGGFAAELLRAEPWPLRATLTWKAQSATDAAGVAWAAGAVGRLGPGFINAPVHAILGAHWSRSLGVGSRLASPTRTCLWWPHGSDWSISAGLGAWLHVCGGVTLFGQDGQLGVQVALGLTW